MRILIWGIFLINISLSKKYLVEVDDGKMKRFDHNEKMKVSDHDKDKEITETGHDEKMTISDHDKEITETVVDEITETDPDKKISGSDYQSKENARPGCSDSKWCRHVWVQKSKDCDGVYTLTKSEVPWAPGKPVYKLQNRNRYIFQKNGKFRIGEFNKPPIFSSVFRNRHRAGSLRKGWTPGWTRGLTWTKKDGVAPTVNCICLPTKRIYW